MFSQKNKIRWIVAFLSFILFITVGACILPGATAQFQGDKIQYAAFIYTDRLESPIYETLVLEDKDSWNLVEAPIDPYPSQEYLLISTGSDVEREFWIILINDDSKFFYYVETYEEWVSFKYKTGVCFRFPYQTNIVSGVRYVANNALKEVPCP